MKKVQVKLFRNEISPFLEILSVFFTVSIDGFRRISVPKYLQKHVLWMLLYLFKIWICNFSVDILLEIFLR